MTCWIVGLSRSNGRKVGVLCSRKDFLSAVEETGWNAREAARQWLPFTSGFSVADVAGKQSTLGCTRQGIADFLVEQKPADWPY